MFNQSHLDQIFSKYCQLATDPLQRLTKEQIAVLVSTVYFASIRLEEGEKVLPRVFAAASLKLMYPNEVPIFRFSEKVNFSVEWLRKFSLAVDHGRSSILVTPELENWVVHGVSHELWRPTDEGNVSRGTYGVVVAAKGVGTVSVTVGSTHLGVFRDGNFHRTSTNVFKDPGFRKLVCGIFGQDWGSADRQNEYLQDLELLVREAAGLQRGGTIVLAKRLHNPATIGNIEAAIYGGFDHLRSNGGNIQMGYQNEVLNHQGESYASGRINASRRRLLQFVAQLSAIDGALILDHRFEPIAVGAKLKAPAYTGAFHLAGKSEEVQDASFQPVGTRHTSATNFVAESKTCAAFVISSDGPVSAFLPSNGAIAVWRNVLG